MGKLYNWHELSGSEQSYLQAVSEFFRENCRWPNYRLLERELRKQDPSINFDETVKSIERKFHGYPQLYSWDPKRQAVLNVLTLSICPGMMEELDGFLKILQYCVDRYDNDKSDDGASIGVSCYELMSQLNMSQNALCKAAILFKEGPWAAFHGDPINGGMDWSFDIGENIRAYRNIRTIEGYMDVKYGKDEFTSHEGRPIGDTRSMEIAVPLHYEAKSTEVFVVHGHDEGARESVARYLELKGLKPVILHEQANRGMTIIEKFERHSDVPFAVVLLTPDDVGASKDDTNALKPRARQNVLLEWGYFVGRLGRSNVCALYKRGVELPSDMDGLIWIEMDTAGAWKTLLEKELREAGMLVE